MNLQLKYTLPGQTTQTVPVKNLPMVLGTLLSNHVVLRAVGVEPIHALLEDEGGRITITDLGSVTGVAINGQKVQVQSAIKPGDRITLGSVEIEVAALEMPAPPPAPRPQNLQNPAITQPAVPNPVTKTSEETPDKRERKELLFSPRKARPTGDILECVAYWDDTVVEVDLFHPSFKDFSKVIIGDTSKKAHFIAAGDADVKEHVLAAFGSEGFKIQLLEGMEARFRKGGEVESASGPSKHRLGRKDIAHIKYGPIKYFLLFVRPPELDLPRAKVRDPLIALLTTIAMVLYLAVIPALWLASPKEIEKTEDDLWAQVQLPRKEEPPPKPKPEVKVEQVKQPPPPTAKPPPPKMAPPKPVKPVEVEKPKQPEPVKNPVEKQAEKPQTPATDSLQKSANNAQQQNQPKPPTPQAKPNPNAGGMASTGSKSPDFKKAGPPNNNPSPKSGGAVGSGMNQQGGARKGTQGVSQMGVEGAKNNSPSAPNLSKLGLGVGKIINQAGPGAIRTNFQNSAGGAGGGSGSASRNYGLGGVGSNSSSLGLSGSGGAVNNFGSGGGGFGSGENGRGGLGGAGIGKGFGTGDGRGRANVSVPASGAEVSQGLTRQEILQVIQTNLAQIRHCYEQLLQKRPNAAGKLTIQFVITASGSVAANVGVPENTMGDTAIEGCITGRVRRWDFPAPRGAASVDVKYPFAFNPL